MMNQFDFNYNVGDVVYLVEDFNQYYDNVEDVLITRYGDKKITEWTIEGFIVDSDGIFIAEDGHDGWNKIKTYHNLTLEKYGDCKIFDTEEDAFGFIESIR